MAGTLKAVIWRLANASDYIGFVLYTVNLGEDTDTIDVIASEFACAAYDLKLIPADWLATLQMRNYIENMCEKSIHAI